MTSRLIHVTTVPESLGFLRGQARYMKSLGWDVHAVSSHGPLLEQFGATEGCVIHPLEMSRRITPSSDLASVAALSALFLRLRPTTVHAHTPKGGLLGMLAAAATRVPVRIYHMRGLPLATATGARRRLLTATEQSSCGLAQHVLCQSHSLRAQALELELTAPQKIEVLGSGSNGVDARGRFNPDALRERRQAIRHSRNWTDEHVVLGFVGRLVKDKGIVELAAAWSELRERYPQLRLVLVGPFESGDPIPEKVRRALEADPRVELPGFSPLIEDWMSAIDVFALPSYREGFPNAPLEAAAMELPVVATRIPGCVDAVVDGVTGTLVEPRDAAALVRAIAPYIESRELRRKQGVAGRERALREFQPEVIWTKVAQVYERLASRRGIQVPSATWESPALC